MVYTSRTRVVHSAPPTPEAADVQQERWVGGKFALMRTHGPRLLRAGDPPAARRRSSTR